MRDGASAPPPPDGKSERPVRWHRRLKGACTINPTFKNMHDWYVPTELLHACRIICTRTRKGEAVHTQKVTTRPIAALRSQIQSAAAHNESQPIYKISTYHAYYIYIYLYKCAPKPNQYVNLGCNRTRNPDAFILGTREYH